MGIRQQLSSIEVAVMEEEGFPLAVLSTYLAMIQGSVHSQLYRYLYIKTPDGEVDVIRNGDLGCAFHVSSILSQCGLIRGIHTTVSGVLRDLGVSGWYNLDKPTKPRPGSVIVWAEKQGSDGVWHRHVGFCLNEVFAVSNDSHMQSPQQHGLHSLRDHKGSIRTIDAAYYHSCLDS